MFQIGVGGTQRRDIKKTLKGDRRKYWIIWEMKGALLA